MDAMQQHMLDTYRAACLGEPAPPRRAATTARPCATSTTTG
ncbi:hypothetical protein ACN24M_23485 [Streptomyces microflavus]